MKRSRPSRSCAARGAVSRIPISSTAASTAARGDCSPATGSCAPTISTRSARVNTAFSIFSAAAANRALLSGARADARRAARASRNAGRSTSKLRASSRHCCCNWIHPSSSGLAGRVAFWAAASCAALNAPSTETRLCAAHSRNCDDRRDHARMVSRLIPAISAIPVDGSTGSHSIPNEWCSSLRSVA